MYTEKPPVARKRAGGFSRLYRIFIPALLAAAGLVAAAAPAEAATSYSYSLGRPIYYLRPGTSTLPVVSGWCVTAVWNEGAVNKGVHYESTRIDDYGAFVVCTNLGLVFEKAFGRTLAGVGGGYMGFRWENMVTPPRHSGYADIYGKVTILNVGKGSLRGFMASRWTDPVPFASRILFHAGLEVCLDL